MKVQVGNNDRALSSHQLARKPPELPDLPVAVHANNHTYISAAHSPSHGPLKVGLLESYAGQHVVIGNVGRRRLNHPNWWVSSMLIGDAPEDHQR